MFISLDFQTLAKYLMQGMFSESLYDGLKTVLKTFPTIQMPPGTVLVSASYWNYVLKWKKYKEQ